jgi:hypothetical protein
MSDDPTKTLRLATPESVPLIWDPRTLRKYWLEAMTQVTDGYLRSPAFLELMQHGMRTMTLAMAASRHEPSADSPNRSDQVPIEGDSHR